MLEAHLEELLFKPSEPSDELILRGFPDFPQGDCPLH
jgi:hypothetical protein